MKGFKIIIGVLILILAGIGSLFILEVVKSRGIKAEEGEILVKLNMAKDSKKEFNKLRKEIAALEKEVAAVNDKIPQNERIPFKLIKGLTLLGNQESLRNIEFSYSEAASESSNFGSLEDEIKVVPLHISMSCQGTYRRLFFFLRRLFELDRIVSIIGINIKRNKAILPKQSVKINLITYTFITQQEEGWRAVENK